VRQRLDVLHEGRPAAHAALEHPRRGRTRQTGAALDHVDDGRLLARDEAVGRLHHLDPPGVPALAQGGLDGAADRAVRRQDQDRAARPDRLGREQQAVDDQVHRQQDGVLAAGGLALRGIADDDGRPAAGRHRPPLAPGGEAGAAPPGEARGVQRGQQEAGPAAQGDRSVPVHVGRQVAVRTLLEEQPG
jgi:hypothetical protein